MPKIIDNSNVSNLSEETKTSEADTCQEETLGKVKETVENL